MKKIITISLVFILAMSLLTACGGNNDNNNPNGNGNNSTPGNSQGTESTPGNNSNFKYGKAEDYIAKNLGDFSITYRVSAGGTEAMDWKTIKTSQGAYFSAGGLAMLYYKEGDKYKMYMGGNGDWMDMHDSVGEEGLKDAIESVTGLMIKYDGFDTEDFKSAGTENIAGRTCDKYTFDLAYAGTALKYEIWIDQATGVCMKYQYDLSVGGQSSGMTYECTEFLTSGVTLPKPN